MVDDERRNEVEDELRRQAKKSFDTGMTAFRRGDYLEALSALDDALELCQDISDSECGQADWIVLGFVEGWLCRGGCRGGGGVVSMVAVFGGGG